MDFLISAFFLYLLWCFYLVFRSFFTKSSADNFKRLPPGPPPLPIIGNLLSLGRLPHRSLHDLSRTYGPIIRLSLGQVTTVFVSSPSLAREIMQTHDASFSNRFVPDVLTAHRHHQLGLGFIPVSPLFRTLRKICNVHIFAAKTLDANRHLRVEQVRLLICEVAEFAEKGLAVDIGNAAFRTTLGLLSNTTFSADMADLSAGEMKDLAVSISNNAGCPNISDYFPVLKRWDIQGLRRRMEGYFGRIFEIFDGMIEKRMEMRAERGYSRRDDLLETLLDFCQDKSEDGFDVSVMKHLLLDVFLAGTDTTASTLEWAMTELLRSQEKLSKAQAELHNEIGKGNLVQEEYVPRLPYLQAVVKETFRLHPPAPFLLPRLSSEDKQVGGHIIPKGAQVFINVWGMGRDPSVWGENASGFTPERFLGSDIDVKGQHFELAPFGSGRRICPGLPLATRMLHMMLGSLLNNFDWKPEDGVAGENITMDERFGLSLHKTQSLKAVPTVVV